MAEEIETDGRVETAGERLRAAREAQGITLEDVAARTRIPTRHLESLEAGDWSKLPAATYSLGFAKSYASAVGLDRNEIADQLRAEMSGYSRRPASAPEIFEPADPARVMPRWLVLLAVLAVLAVIAGLMFLRNREISGPDEVPPPAEAPAAPASAPTAAPAAPPAASGPVVLTANAPVWLRIYERDGRTLFQGELAAGQTYQVPADATAPLLRTGKAEALRATVGTASAPPIGGGASSVRDISLLGPDLMRGGTATPGPQSAAPRP